jgi:hypothetical protein
VGGTGPVKSFFDPASGHRETVWRSRLLVKKEDIGFVALVQVFPGILLRIALAINAARKGT